MGSCELADRAAGSGPVVALLTGGGDRPYAVGLATSLASQGVALDFIGSDFLDVPEVRTNPLIRFLNLRGNTSPDAPLATKVVRVAKYYARLLRYAVKAKPAIFHVLWNDKLELFDRTLLMLFYRFIGKRVVLTVHNVNALERDGNDGLFNRLTLRAQYRLVDHLFVHSEQMKRALENGFGVKPSRITVIPFGINSTVPDTTLTSSDARRRLGLREEHKVVLFFGNIAPYKGLEHLLDAMEELTAELPEARLVVAGRPKGPDSYWRALEQRLTSPALESRTVARIEYVPDADTEVYFKGADVLALPYTQVFQSGVLFLGYNFGLPVVATDVGALADEVIEGETGYICAPRDPAALANTLRRLFSSDLYRNQSVSRRNIRAWAANKHSWTTVVASTRGVYAALWEEHLRRGRTGATLEIR